MKIAFCSYTYAPSIGGIESTGQLLVQEFRNRGHDIQVITETSAGNSSEILRKPAKSVLKGAFKNSHLVFLNNLSMPYFISALQVRKPVAVATHTWIRRPNGIISLTDRIKMATLRLANLNIALSEALARSILVPAQVIHPPYNTDVFYLDPGISRSRELVCVGRLVSDKGVDLLLHAMALLRDRFSMKPHLTIVGSGPERPTLESLVIELSLSSQIEFTGTRTGADLREVLNAHQVMVVPSRWEEPFGIVVLEGIACGNVVIGSQGGGLPEAIGPCGVTFQNENVEDLTEKIYGLLSKTLALEKYRAKAQGHLRRFRKEIIADEYLSLFGGVLASRG